MPRSRPRPTAFSPACADFYKITANDDGSFRPGVVPDYKGMADTPPAIWPRSLMPSFCTKHSAGNCPTSKRRSRSCNRGNRRIAQFFNVNGTNKPESPSARIYNTTQGIVALHALGVRPKYDPLPVFEQVMRRDYTELPAYSTSFFPLAYRAAGVPWPKEFDRRVRALMVQSDDGYLNDHIAATFHAAHYYSLLGEPTPKAEAIVRRTCATRSPTAVGFSTRRPATGTRRSTPFSR